MSVKDTFFGFYIAFGKRLIIYGFFTVKITEIYYQKMTDGIDNFEN